jgi:hypothetical protein
MSGPAIDIPMITRPVKPTPTVPIMSVNELSGLTEKQLFDVFTQGVPDIPSALPGERGAASFCRHAATQKASEYPGKKSGEGNGGGEREREKRQEDPN